MDLLQSYHLGWVFQYPKQRTSRKQGGFESSGSWEVRAKSWPSLEETSQVGMKDKASPDQQGTLLRKQKKTAGWFSPATHRQRFLSCDTELILKLADPSKGFHMPSGHCSVQWVLESPEPRWCGAQPSRETKTLPPPLHFQLTSPAVRVDSSGGLIDWRLALWDKYGPQSLPSLLQSHCVGHCFLY